MKAIVNTTPLVALSVVAHLDLLNKLFDQVIVPESVISETLAGGDRAGAAELKGATWIRVQRPSDELRMPTELRLLDPGERDVIRLALEHGADWVLIDEKLGRRVATNLGLNVKGTMGVLLLGVNLGLISKDEARIAANTLAQSSIRLSRRLLDWFVEQLG